MRPCWQGGPGGWGVVPPLLSARRESPAVHVEGLHVAVHVARRESQGPGRCRLPRRAGLPAGLRHAAASDASACAVQGPHSQEQGPVRVSDTTPACPACPETCSASSDGLPRRAHAGDFTPDAVTSPLACRKACRRCWGPLLTLKVFLFVLLAELHLSLALQSGHARPGCRVCI